MLFSSVLTLGFSSPVYPKKDTTHTLIANKLTVALRARSSVWQCRYNVDGKWQERVPENAI